MEEDLIIYIKQGCPYCNRLMSMLKDRDIEFRTVDVYSDDPEAQNAVTRGGKKPTPQVEFMGRIIYDYTNEEELADEIAGWFSDEEGDDELDEDSEDDDDDEEED